MQRTTKNLQGRYHRIQCTTTSTIFRCNSSCCRRRRSPAGASRGARSCAQQPLGGSGSPRQRSHRQPRMPTSCCASSRSAPGPAPRLRLSRCCSCCLQKCMQHWNRCNILKEIENGSFVFLIVSFVLLADSQMAFLRVALSGTPESSASVSSHSSGFTGDKSRCTHLLRHCFQTFLQASCPPACCP